MAEPQDLPLDPRVSRAKFEREVGVLLSRRWEEHRRGWFLLDATFPKVFVVFAKPDLNPKTVLFGVEIDFANFDLWPPSVRFVDPFTREPFSSEEAADEGIALPRWRESDQQGPTESLLQANEDPSKPPSLCIPGTREYHQHPAHSEDSWLLHRGRGEGNLYFLLEKIYEHGVLPVSGFRTNIRVEIAGRVLDANRVPR